MVFSYKILLIWIVIYGSLKHTLAQSIHFELPTYQIRNPEDCLAYNTALDSAVVWWLSFPLIQQTEKRKKVFKFILAWATRSPEVNVEINGYIMPLFSKNPDLWASYTAFWIQKERQQPMPKLLNQADEWTYKRVYHQAALEGILKIYQKETLNYDESLEKLLILQQENKLHAWIDANWNK